MSIDTLMRSFRECEACGEILGRGRDCSACDEQRHRDRIRNAQVPTALRAVTFDDVDRHEREHVVEVHRAFARGEITGVYSEGNVGTGKTHLAAAAFNALVRDHAEALWISAPAAVILERAPFGDERRDRLMAELTAATPLAIDDIDKAPKSAGPLMFTAIDQRISAGAPLLVTSNVTLRGLARHFTDRYGAAIASRLAGHCARVQLTGPDRRLQSAA